MARKRILAKFGYDEISVMYERTGKQTNKKTEKETDTLIALRRNTIVQFNSVLLR